MPNKILLLYNVAQAVETPGIGGICLIKIDLRHAYAQLTLNQKTVSGCLVSLTSQFFLFMA